LDIQPLFMRDYHSFFGFDTRYLIQHDDFHIKKPNYDCGSLVLSFLMFFRHKAYPLRLRIYRGIIGRKFLLVRTWFRLKGIVNISEGHFHSALANHSLTQQMPFAYPFYPIYTVKSQCLPME